MASDGIVGANLLLPGRKSEVSRLGTIIERVEHGTPQVVAVEGAAGIGKTTLLNHLMTTTPEWQHHVVELDPSDEEIQGTALRRLLASMTGDRGIKLAETIEENVQHLLDVLDGITDPTCVILEDVQWVDPLSAEVLWRCARELTHGHTLVVVSCRPRSAQFLSRFERFLASGRRGEHFLLEPLSVEGVQEVLMHRLEVPISTRIARTVHEATNGIPLLLSTVAQWLTNAPSSQRQLSAALAALHTPQDGPRRIFNRALLASLDSLADAQRFAVQALAVAGTALRHGRIQQLLEEEGHERLGMEELLIAGLTAARTESAELTITHPGLAPLIAQQIPVEDRARLHTSLASHTSGEHALHHRVQAQLLAPQPVEIQRLVGELMTAGGTALLERRPEAAFRYFHWASWFSADARILALSIRAAAQANPTELLPTIRTQLEQADSSRAVCAAKAQLLLAEGDLTSALTELEHGFALPEPDADYAGTILLAYALASAGRLGYATARFGATAGTVDIALAQLADARTKLTAASAENETAARLLPEVMSLEGLLKLWSGLRHGDPSRLDEFSDQMNRVIDELGEIPGTRAVSRTIHGVLGSIARKQDDLTTAYSMLQTAYEGHSGTDEMTVHTASHLGLIAFHSGHWDEAQQLFTRAIEDSLLLPEDAGAMLAYAAAALVPLGRGETTEGEALLRRLEQQQHHEGGEVVHIAVMFARAIGALMARDHETAVRSFSVIDESSFGWAYVGYSYLPMFARVLMMTGRAELIPQLKQRVELQARGINPAAREAIMLALDSASSWSSGHAMESFEQLDRAITLLDTLPPVRPGVTANPGGGYALSRAFAAVHLGQITLYTPQLAHHRSRTARLVQDAAAVFLRCGAMVIHADAVELATMLIRSDEMSVSSPDEPLDSDEEVTALRELAYKHLSTLTSRERQIALEVAQGKSNREIATALFLSVRTVEYHVANCLSKLNLPSRVELRGALRPALAMRLTAPWATADQS